MNEQTYRTADDHGDDRDRMARYLDVAAMALLVAGLASRIFPAFPDILVGAWSLAIFVFLLARVRQFYVRYQHTRLLYWLPILLGNVKQRVYVRPRLSRTFRERHQVQPLAGGAAAIASGLGEETPTDEGIVSDEVPYSEEPLEADDELLSAMPEDAVFDEFTDAETEQVAGIDHELEKPVPADKNLPLTPPADAPALGDTPSITSPMRERLRSRLGQGAQALTYLAPPLAEETQAIAEDESEESAADALATFATAERVVEVEAPEREAVEEAWSSEPEVEQPVLIAEEAQISDEAAMTPAPSGAEEAASATEGASSLHAHLQRRQQITEPPLAAAPVVANLKTRLRERQLHSTELPAPPPAPAAGNLHDRLQQRAVPSAAEPPVIGESSAEESSSHQLADRRRERAQEDSSALPASDTPAETITDTKSDAAARLRERLRQRQEGES